MMNTWTYDQNKVGTLYVPNVAGAIAAGAAQRVDPSEHDTQKEILVLVDTQVDFVHADGALSVPGAVEDTKRTIDFILKRTASGKLTAIAASLDSHLPIQIFFSSWWEDRNGNEPAPFTAITSESIAKGEWRPRYDRKWSIDYVKKLEDQSKKVLMIWPYHTKIGTPGHAMTPALYEAVVYHSAARLAQPVFLTKGSIPKTEHYSILEPEVKVPNHPQGGLNTHFLDMLATYDRIYIAGQAKSHCVLETVESIQRYFQNDQTVLNRCYYLMDCMSSVAHPQIDFESIAQARYNELARMGTHLVLSTQVA
jgi:nicotinamidase/pyrazinamidase